MTKTAAPSSGYTMAQLASLIQTKGKFRTSDMTDDAGPWANVEIDGKLHVHGYELSLDEVPRFIAWLNECYVLPLPAPPHPVQPRAGRAIEED